jgi:hypothetical protein
MRFAGQTVEPILWETTMRTICAWCKEELHSDESDLAGSDVPISHGICPDCIIKFFSFMGKPMRDYLDEFAGPVFLVDATNKIISANSEGLALIHKASDEIEEKLAGDIFECPHTSQAEGCGNTIHCKSCTIKNAIVETSQTGKAMLRIPAYQDLHSFSKNKKTQFFISTEKVEDAVLLRIDDLPIP